MSSAHLSDRLAKRVLWGLVIGLLAGIAVRAGLHFQPQWESRARWIADEVLGPFGQIFLRMLFFVIVPLVFASLTLGVTQLGRLDRLGPLAGKTFALFGLNMAIGVALGLVFMNVVQPGKGLSQEVTKQLQADASLQKAADEQIAKATAQRETGYSFATLLDLFMPRNLVGAIAGSSPNQLGNVLALIVFALLVGAAGTMLPDEKRQGMMTWLSTVGELMTTIVFWAMKLAPYAVAALIASAVMKFGLGYLKSLAVFTIGVILVIAVHLFGTMSLLLKLFTQVSPLKFFGAIKTILITAFSTSSSNATLPTSIAVTQEKLGVSASTAGFVLPLGATMNMSGSALYEGCVVLFLAQVAGVPLDLTQQLLLLLLAVVSAVAVAGIPGATTPFIIGLLITFGIDASYIALILGVDRLLDMCRTTLNVAADVVTAVIVDQKKPAAAG